MGYATESAQALGFKDGTTLTVIDALKATTKICRINQPMTLHRVGAAITVIADGVITVAFTKRITIGSDTSAVTVGTITIPDTTAVGKVVMAQVTPIDLNVGDELKAVVSNTGTSTAIEIFAIAVPRSETMANQSDAVISALT